MKLLECTGPIDKKAANVIKQARPEDVWMPSVKEFAHMRFSRNVLPTASVPRAASHMSAVLGQRRDKLTVVGYAADQSTKKGARWVVRCDCGNFEHRASILRWLGTDAPDMCRECRIRTYRTRGETFPRERASRSAVEVR